MDLSNLDLTRLFPTWMQDASDDVALAEIVDLVAAEVSKKAPLLSQWSKIDELPEDMLEELAWALDITWWDSEASIETKRALVKSSDYIHSKLGTTAAMEDVARAYLGDGDVLEWFEYGGQPHHFKIYTENLAMIKANCARLLDRLFKVKRHSSKLDSILIGLTAKIPLFYGAAVQESSYQEAPSASPPVWQLCGCGAFVSDTVQVRTSPTV